MARIVADIHAAGWAWRDCKPANFMCQKNRKLLALDFEGACPVHDPDPLWWGTPGYAPSPRRRKTCDLEAVDLYALGTSIMQLIGRNNSPTKSVVAFQREIRKQKLPRFLAETIRRLRSPDRKRRPSAHATQRALGEVLRYSD
jgi:serine/threonine protein kinase